jgi:formylglycine-generating enzyme required for sulfatase activity
VGLIYGPSGCGKSSLVKAGLLPRVAGHVLPVYVEATREDTERRLLNELQKQFPAVPESASLPDVIGLLREGLWLPAGNKTLIVLDQFEQWLHAQQGEQASQLVYALRQCDGGRVQSIVLVRDDFWLAVSRFLSDLEVPILQDRNVKMVDLFDPFHARRVLAEFGRAFGRLPDAVDDLSPEQESFLRQAVEALAPDGRVVCVRLALFAEMLKSRSWRSSTLREIGGAEGVGVAFLEETFSAPSANPAHRLHEKAARFVLKALLPESGMDIKAQMRSYDDLLDASGYAGHPQDFEALVRILDSETRLITPTEREGAETTKADDRETPNGGKYYQLTHDYLVNPLREWLSGKQKESRRGRAELRLAERSAVWNVKLENRHLPAWWEDLNIRLFTRRMDWTESQRRMMRRSGRRHGVRGLAILAILLTLVWGGYESIGFVRASDLISNLTKAEIGEVPQCIRELEPHRRWADARLTSLAAQDVDAKAKLHSSLALVKHDASHQDYLYQHMLGSAPRTLEVICEELKPHKADLTNDLWNTAKTDADMQRRFKAACALASYAPADSKGWEQIRDSVSCQLVETLSRSPRDFGVLLRLLSSVRHQLGPSLGPLVYDTQRSELERSTALNILMEYADDQPTVIADVLMEATPEQFARLYPWAQPKSVDVAPLLKVELRKTLAEKPGAAEKERLGRRQAQAAIALLRMGHLSEMRPLLRSAPDPRARTYFIHRASRLGVVPAELIRHVTIEPVAEVLSSQRALLLSLGEFNADQLPAQQREPLIETLLGMYERHGDPGLHGAAAWLLRRWGQAERIAEVDQRLKQTEDQLRSRPKADRRQWYINTRGQTFVVIPDARRFLMGSPETEPDRNVDEILHSREIGRTFAIAATEVTRAEFQAFLRSARGWQEALDYVRNVSPCSKTDLSPAVWPTWYEAAEYCNWLSEQEGIPQEQWCYERNEKEKYEAGMKPKPDYLLLKGYRLPTEAEWEYACRAGAVTSRYYGSSAELLVHYGRYEASGQRHAWPAAGLKPNEFGLFDMLGNVYEWCHDRYEDYPEDGTQPVPDTADSRVVDDHALRVLRGGSFDDSARFLRSALRMSDLPAARTDVVGFRPARTFR